MKESVDLHYEAVIDTWEEKKDESDKKSIELPEIYQPLSTRTFKSLLSKWFQSKWTKIVFLLAFVQALILISCEVVMSILYFCSHIPRFTDVLLYLILICFSQLFQFYFMLDAIHSKNTIQLIVYIILNIIMCTCAVFQLVQMHINCPKTQSFVFYNVLPFLVIIIATLGLNTIIISWLVYSKLYLEFGWHVYKKIGIDPRYIQFYKNHQVLLMLIKLDTFFFIVFSLQMIVLVLEPSNLEFSLTIAAIPISVIVLIMAVHAVRKESKILMIVFLNGLGIGAAYFCFKTFRLYQSSQAFRYESSRSFLTFMAVICFVAVTITFVYACKCFYQFGKGLKELIQSRKEQHGKRILVL